jgi:hypothetical protein
MAKSKSEVVAFNAGELGKEALARVDIENYPRGAEIMENIFPLRQGGMTKMPGTIYVAGTPSNAQAWLRPWVFSDEVRIGIEISATKIRFIEDGALMTIVGAAATVGAFSDESTAATSGGGAPPDGGTGDVDTGGFDGGPDDGRGGGFGGDYIP